MPSRLTIAVTLLAPLLALGMPVAGTAQGVTTPPVPVDVPGVGLVYFEPVPADDTTSVRRIIEVPGYGKVLIIPVRATDNRSPRQICIDEAVKKEGGRPSRLAWRVIDLKCSQL
jgi:hypothetical protein